MGIELAAEKRVHSRAKKHASKHSSKSSHTSFPSNTANIGATSQLSGFAFPSNQNLGLSSPRFQQSTMTNPYIQTPMEKIPPMSIFPNLPVPYVPWNLTPPEE